MNVGEPSPWLHAPAGYAADWRAFATWAAIVDQTALPATGATVASWCTAERAAPATLGRRVAALNWVHGWHGFAPPGVDSAVRTVLGRGDSYLRDKDQRKDNPVELIAALRAMPLHGWPTAMYAARDALLLHLRGRSGLTWRQIGELTSAAINVDTERFLVLGLPGGTLMAAPGPDPALCAACIWVRWRWWLSRLRKFWTMRSFAERIDDGSVIPPNAESHRCEASAGHRSPTESAGVPVIPAIQRWGAVVPLQPMRRTDMVTTYRAHMKGDPPIHLPFTPRAVLDARKTAAAASAEAARIEVIAATPPPPYTNRDWLAGLQARADARRSLEQGDRRLAWVEDEADAALSRAQSLMSDGAELSETLRNLRRK